MMTPASHLAYPWPGRVRRWVSSLLGVAVVMLIVAFAPTVGAVVGLAFSQDAIDAWLALFVPLGATFLGAALGVMARGIVVVNRGRDGRTSRFLLPSRAGVIETGSRALLVVFVTVVIVFAAVFGGIGAALALGSLL